jgi:hypothetical protein
VRISSAMWIVIGVGVIRVSSGRCPAWWPGNAA